MYQTARKWIAGALAAFLLALSSGVGFAAQDIEATRGVVLSMLLEAADSYRPDVKAEDIMHGDERGLRENDPVTRAEALVMLNRAFGGFPEQKGHNKNVAIPKGAFTDIPVWAEGELAPVFDAGLVAGTAAGIFSPDDTVTVGQMQLFIQRAYAAYGANLKDNFYAAVNHGALETLVFKNGSTEAGTLQDISEKTGSQVAEIILKAARSTPEPGSAQEKIKILYDNIMDIDTRNQLGIEPIRAQLDAIDNAKTLADLDEIEIMEGAGVASSLLVDFGLSIDMQDSTSYIPLFSPAEALCSKQVYTGELPVQKNAYLKYITTLLQLCGHDATEAAKRAEEYVSFEALLSGASLDIAEQYDVKKTYNIYTFAQLQQMFPAIDLKKVLDKTGLAADGRIWVMDTGLLEQAAGMMTDENIDAVKNYARTALILSSADFFGEEFRQAYNVYTQEITGTAGSATLQEAAVALVSDMLYDYVGQAYAEMYCSAQMVADVTNMIHDVVAVYKERIANLSWMSAETKQKALKKLDTMHINVGAPDYSKITNPLSEANMRSAAQGGSYYQNAMEIAKAKLRETARLSKTGVDRTQWVTTPHTVNAFYMPNCNSINFPAAFLQAPVYDVSGSYEANMGALGTVIAHEITHAFDSNGSQYDEDGNVVNWWTAEDAAAFGVLCGRVIAYFDGAEAAPGIAVDGELTLTENIADLGALACITQIGENTKEFDFKKMYESYAALWMSTTTRDCLQMLAFSDPHSADSVRVNRVLQSIDKFYETYGIAPGDGMYIPPEERVTVW